MTDRTAALAEALPARLFVALMPEDRDDERREIAAAILAALPEGWCGHRTVAAGREERPTQNIWDSPEIARLRKIEEAAREVSDGRHGSTYHDVGSIIERLRAALEAER